mgnify:CR=1 FL=1
MLPHRFVDVTETVSIIGEFYVCAIRRTATFSRQTLQNLSGGTLDLTKQQNTQRPSVVIRRMSENAALWDLARQYRTTAQSIQQANHLTQPEADAGRLLLIPM